MSNREASITSELVSTGKATRKQELPTKRSSSNPKSDKAASGALPTAGKGKRTMTESPPAVSAKRSSNLSTTIAQQKHLAYNDLPADWLNNGPKHTGNSEKEPSKTLQLTYHKGDMFHNAPSNCLLIHACNTQGHWGAGIAKAFKDLYPKAFAVHRKFCAVEHSKTSPVPTGTAQLLAPVDGDPLHWIGCVFTSAKYGRAKDKPDAIVRNTVLSMEMLLELVKLADGGSDGVSTIRMCKINSGKFGVPWEKTEKALQSIVMREGWRVTVEVWEP